LAPEASNSRRNTLPHNAISSTSLTVYLIAYLLLLRPASVAFPEGSFGQSHWSIPSEHCTAGGSERDGEREIFPSNIAILNREGSSTWRTKERRLARLSGC
jgi:hypothetical protein